MPAELGQPLATEHDAPIHRLVARAEHHEKSLLAVTGPLILNDADIMIHAAADGMGIALALDDEVAGHIASGRLVRLFARWCTPYPGYHLYYPGRRQTPALAALIERLRARPRNHSSLCSYSELPEDVGEGFHIADLAVAGCWPRDRKSKSPRLAARE